MKTRSVRGITAISLLTVGLGAAALTGCGGSSASNANTTATGAAQGSAVLPVPKNPITSTSTKPGLEISKVLVENNVSPDTGKAVSDHLEVTLRNTGAAPLTGLELYYRITDPALKRSEGYYTKLTGASLDPGATRVIHFDNTGATDHYPVNRYSLYYNDKNALVIDVTAGANGVKPATFTVRKDAGGAEAGVE
ncbi:MAG: hypothetical protein U0237_16980 [Thermoleophilia bacterium]